MYPRLRDLREDADLNQLQLARLLGMSQTGYSKYETGENDIPTQVLIKLAQLYKTNVDYILGLTNKKMPYRYVKLSLICRAFFYIHFCLFSKKF